VTWKLVDDKRKIFLSAIQKSSTFVDRLLALLPPYTVVLRAQDQTEAGFVQQYNNWRLLATGLKLVNLFQSESFCSVVTKYFFLLQKKGKSFTGVAKKFS